MASLQVHDVMGDGEMTVLVVRCLRGTAEVGHRLVSLRREDGSQVPLDVEIVGISTIAGDSQVLGSGEAGRVRVQAGQLVAGLRRATIETTPPGRARPSTAEAARTARLQQSGESTWSASAAADTTHPSAATDPWQAPAPAETGPRPPGGTWQPLVQTRGGVVGLSVGPALPMGRWGIGFRLPLVVPMAAVSLLLGFLVGVVQVIGWFAALLTGKLPQGVARFLAGCLAFTARITAYQWLLTGRYPPFAFDVPDHPVQVQVAAGQLSRVKVFFRGLLALPVSVLVIVLTYGWVLMSVPLWAYALIRGRLPDAAQEAGTAALRFLVRTNAYLLLLTDTYPGGLWGDRPPPGAMLGVDLRGTHPLSPTQAAGQLVLSRTARRVVTGLLPLGLVGLVAVVAADYATLGSHLTANPAPSIELAHARLTQQIQVFQGGLSGCQRATDPLVCLQGAATTLAEQFDSFDATLSSLRLPQSAAPAGRAVQADAEQMSAQLHGAARVGTVSAYVETLRSPAVAQAGQAFDSDYAALLRSLGTGG